MANSTEKPPKPYPEFPLYSHNSKRWAKKVRTRTHFFGPWRDGWKDDSAIYQADWQAAFDRYNHEMPYLLQGKTPPARDSQALTVGTLVNSFLEHREDKMNSGELSPRTWDDYERTAKLIIKHFGRHTTVESLQPADFAALRRDLGKERGLVSLKSIVGRVRVIFNYAHKNLMVDKPVRMGLSFSMPSDDAIAIEKAGKVERIFTLTELQTLYHAADRQIQAFMLLALNAGLGNGDIGRLEFRHLQDGWLRYPRPKTGVKRECPLWLETIAAIEDSKQTKSTQPYVFLTQFGGSWHKSNTSSPLSREFTRLCERCELYQEGRSFYALRHQFRTVADGSRDLVAIDRIMGHKDPSQGAKYREWIAPERLQAVVDHVRAWVAPMFEEPKQ